MTLAFYFDQNVDRSIADGLRRRDVHVLTAWEDGVSRRDDESLFEHAISLGMIFVSNDRDLPVIVARWLRTGRSFPGLVRTRQAYVTVGMIVDDLELIAKAITPEALLNQTLYVPFPRTGR